MTAISDSPQSNQHDPARSYGEQLGQAIVEAFNPPDPSERALLALTEDGYKVDEYAEFPELVRVAKPGHEPIRVTREAFEDLPVAYIKARADRAPLSRNAEETTR